MSEAPDVASVARPVVPLRHGAVAALAELGEGPVWDAAREELVWVDIDRGLVHRRRRGWPDVTFDAGQPLGCAVPRAGGGLALALKDGFALLPPGGGRAEVVAPIEPDRPAVRMNDGACDARGRFFAGTMSLAGDTRTCALYRLDPDLHATCVLPGISVSNGIDWSPDESLLYHVDSPRRRIDVYDFDAERGTLPGRRAVIPVAPDRGVPDGLSVDAEGGIWVAIWGGAAIHHYSPDGTLEGLLELPVTNVTSCCFGGSDLATLYVTTAARGAEQEPLAGALFACRPGVRGRPATPFAG